MLSLVNQNVVVKETHYKCRGCNSTVMKYIDWTPGSLLAKYTCNCVDSRGEKSGPQFPLYKAE